MFWSESGEKSAQIKHRLQDKTALNQYVAGFWCERQQEMHFFTWGSIIMDYGLSQKQWFEVKNCAGFVFVFKMLTTGVVWIIVMFLSAVWHSFWRHPFTAEHPLLRHWCSDTLLQTWWRNASTSWMAWGWAHFQQIFIFGWTINL